jgi:tRNA nucleotidyltransferase (CCA-adding enzyme)
MKVYLVGGAVRDSLLGIEPKDLDYVVVGSTPEKMLSYGFKEVGADFPVFLHPDSGNEYALARKEFKTGTGYKGFSCSFGPEVTIEEDLERRDLTINAMAQDLETSQIIDPFDGQEDLKNGIIRHTSEAFGEDPLRVLRAARFAARFKFNITPETMTLMAELVKSKELNELTPERIWIEVEKALKTDHPGLFFKNLDISGALRVIFPELERLYGVPQTEKYHPEGCAWTHTMLVLEAVCEMTNDTLTRFAALCHDLGKGTTPVEELPSHKGHELRSADMVREVAARWKIPNEYEDLAYIAARFHLKVHKLNEMKPKKILKLIKQTNALRNPEMFNRFLMVCEADNLGKQRTEEYQEKKILNLMVYNIDSLDNVGIIGEETRGHVIKQLIHNAQLSVVRKISNEWKREE